MSFPVMGWTVPLANSYIEALPQYLRMWLYVFVDKVFKVKLIKLKWGD